MRLVLDLQTLQSQSRGRGIGSYSRGLAASLLSHSEQHEWHVLLNSALSGGDPLIRDPELKAWLRDRVDPRNIHFFSGLQGTAGLGVDFRPRENASALLREHLLAALQPDLVHVASPFEGFGDESVIEADDLVRDPPMPGLEWCRAATLYDLIPFERPDHYLVDPQARRFFEKRYRQLGANHLLLAISDHVATSARTRFLPDGPELVAIGADADPAFRPLPPDPLAEAALKARYGITRPYFLHVGILEHRKNVRFLVEAFSGLPQEIRAGNQLVLVARHDAHARTLLAQWRRDFALGDDELVLAGHAAQTDLVRLYTLALATVMPSMAEGFGLPLLESMRCGTPALGARATSLPEVVGHDAYLFDLNDPSELTGQLLKMASDPGFRAKARDHAGQQAKVFSWDRSAKRALEAFEASVQAQRRDARAEAGTRTLPIAAKPRLLELPGVLLAEDLKRIDEGPCILDLAQSGPFELAPALGALLAYRESGFSALPDFAQPHTIADPLGRDARRLIDLHPNILGILGPCGSGHWSWAHALRLGSTGQRPICRGSGASHEGAAEALFGSLASCALAGDLIRFDRFAGLADGLAPGEIGHLARSLVLDRARIDGADHPRRLLVDVSHLAKFDAKSGIQRVVRNILAGLFALNPPFRIEPVFRVGDDWFFARRFATQFLKRPPLPLRDDLVDFRSHDVFLGLDLDAAIPPSAITKMREHKRAGVTFVIVVYDILPLRHPEWFHPGMSEAFSGWIEFLSTCADHLACISQATADDVKAALVERGCPRLDEMTIEPFPLGADILSDPNAAEGDGNLEDLCQAMGVKEFLLTVGTLEPRKGHDHLLAAIELCLAERPETGFVIAGKRGWLVDGVIETLTALSARYPQLRWIEGANDRELASLYQQARAVIVPSRGEGFGLPLIEAEHAGLPVLARDIPVFREIGSASTRYFKGGDGKGLANEILAFLAALDQSPFERGTPARPWLWSESVAALLRLIPAHPAETNPNLRESQHQRRGAR